MLQKESGITADPDLDLLCLSKSDHFVLSKKIVNQKCQRTNRSACLVGYKLKVYVCLDFFKEMPICDAVIRMKGNRSLKMHLSEIN